MLRPHGCVLRGARGCLRRAGGEAGWQRGGHWRCGEAGGVRVISNGKAAPRSGAANVTREERTEEPEANLAKVVVVLKRAEAAKAVGASGQRGAHSWRETARA